MNAKTLLTPENIKAGIAAAEGVVNLATNLIAQLKKGGMTQEEYSAAWAAMANHTVASKANWEAAGAADTVQGAPA